jgi:hypothetical protein
MDVTVRLEDLEDALDWVSAGGGFANAAYVSKATGKIHLASEDEFGDADLPDDVEDADLYWSVPHKRDLDLGRDLVLRFAEEFLPHDHRKVREYFGRQGAYARFKDLLAHRGMLGRWHQYERDAIRKALREWAEDCGMRVAVQVTPE